MKETEFTIIENVRLARSIYRMRLTGDTEDIRRPGQFVNFKLDGLYLRRPISVCDKNGNELTVIYKVVGKGTEMMKEMRSGKVLNVLTGLGNGYDILPAGEAPLLVGGGVGIPPLFWLARKLRTVGKEVRIIMGFNTAEEIFYKDEFESLGCETIIATVDGSVGVKGFAADALPCDYSYLYACGPELMLKSVYKKSKTSGQFSFEERMGCGFGACMGCSCRTISGYKRICKDGPVLTKEEILWED